MAILSVGNSHTSNGEGMASMHGFNQLQQMVGQSAQSHQSSHLQTPIMSSLPQTNTIPAVLMENGKVAILHGDKAITTNMQKVAEIPTNTNPHYQSYDPVYWDPDSNFYYRFRVLYTTTLPVSCLQSNPSEFNIQNTSENSPSYMPAPASHPTIEYQVQYCPPNVQPTNFHSSIRQPMLLPKPSTHFPSNEANKTSTYETSMNMQDSQQSVQFGPILSKQPKLSNSSNIVERLAEQQSTNSDCADNGDKLDQALEKAALNHVTPCKEVESKDDLVEQEKVYKIGIKEEIDLTEDDPPQAECSESNDQNKQVLTNNLNLEVNNIPTNKTQSDATDQLTSNDKQIIDNQAEKLEAQKNFECECPCCWLVDNGYPIIRHRGRKLHMCHVQECSKLINKRCGLHQHLLTHHGGKIEPTRRGRMITFREKRPYDVEYSLEVLRKWLIQHVD